MSTEDLRRRRRRAGGAASDNEDSSDSEDGKVVGRESDDEGASTEFEWGLEEPITGVCISRYTCRF